MKGLGPIWPGRVSVAGITLGDVWPCAALAQRAPAIHTDPAGDTPPTVGVKLGSIAGAIEQTKPEIMVPFHKLTQWLTYSLIVPLRTSLEWTIEGVEDMTGLPEYRNGMFSEQASRIYLTGFTSGGLFVDFSVLEFRRESGDQASIPRFLPSHPAIIEWRAMTVILL